MGMLTTTAMSAMTGKAKGALGCRVGTASSGVRSTTVCRHMRRSQNPATLNNKRRETQVAMGYTYLDVRSSTEFNDDAKTPRAVNIPLFNTTKKWDLSVTPAVQEVTQSANPKFLEQVKEKFPDKESKLLIVCSDGRQRAIQVLMLLDAEGYTNIVGLKGGYIDWNFVFKGTGGNPLFQKLERRGQTVKYSTVFSSDGDDLGVHSTDSTMFGKTDYVAFDPTSMDTETWLKWADEVKTSA